MVRAFIALFLVLPWLVVAQAPAPARPDPLMSLIMAQPRTDIPSNVLATAEFDPPVVRPGELSVYRVTFNALEEMVAWPEQLNAPAALNLRPGGHGQVMQFSGSGFAPRTGFNYHARPTRSGEFTLPSWVVQVYGKPVAVPAARLVVTASPPPTLASAQRIQLDLSSTNLFVGQPVKVRVMLAASASGQVQTLSQVQVNGEGVFVDQGTIRQQIGPIPREGRMVPAYIYETTLTPLKTGKLAVSAQGFTAGNRFSGPIVLSGNAMMPGGLPQFTLVDSEPAELLVRSLPRDGELPGFTGAIGRLSLDPPRVSPDTVRVGDTVKLYVTVRGDGSLARLPAPPPPVTRDWQIFSGSTEAPLPQPFMVSPSGAAPGLPGSAIIFSYTMIPLSDSVRATPIIPFCYFDPARAAYVSLPIPPVSLTVKASLTPADVGALLHPDAEPGGAEKEPVLSDLATSPGLTASSLTPVERRAWFPLVQCAPGLVFAALWAWDRRRRYLEVHPEVLLCRRARRALRRERRIMRRAAQAGDAAGFAAAAVSAMRVACAPHYPAEPRALVGADVVALLPTKRSAPRPGPQAETDLSEPFPDQDQPNPFESADPGCVEVVRRFFTVTDATRFDVGAADASALLPLKPEIEKLLTQLEVRLC